MGLVQKRIWCCWRTLHWAPSEVLLQDGGYVYVAWCKQTDVQVEEFESLCESETGRPE